MRKPANRWDATVLWRCNHLQIPGPPHGTLQTLIMVVLPLLIIKKLHVGINKRANVFEICVKAIPPLSAAYWVYTAEFDLVTKMTLFGSIHKHEWSGKPHLKNSPTRSCV